MARRRRGRAERSGSSACCRSPESVPVALAVIPALAEPRARRLARSGCSACPEIAVLQHGWRHPEPLAQAAKRANFPPNGRLRRRRRELAAGRARIGRAFGARALPILVPPGTVWHDCFLPLLPDCGIRGDLADDSARTLLPAGPGLIEANVHVDLVAWTGDRGFIGESAALGGLVRHLRARRLGRRLRRRADGNSDPPPRPGRGDGRLSSPAARGRPAPMRRHAGSARPKFSLPRSREPR